MRSCVELMRKGGGGAIVNVVSTAESEGVQEAVAYTATKRPVIGMIKVTALELAQYGVRVNAVSTGAIATPSSR
jgi:3alpha(or 20beta)-hydroxysteroid dehydrogenase